MKSAVYAVLLTALVVFSVCEETTTISQPSTIDKVTSDTTTSSLPGSDAYSGTTETTHTMGPTGSTTSGKFSSESSSVTNQTRGSDTTLSVSATTMTQLTDSSTSSDSVTTMSPIPVTPGCPDRSGFDAASFVGGIILALGVMVILVITVKCYQNRMNKSELQYSQF